MWFETLNPILLAEEVQKAWYQQTIPMLLMMIGAIVVSILVGSYYCRSIRMSDYGWKLSLMLSCVLCAAIVIVGAGPPRLGVDLRGGVTFIGQLEVDEDQEAVPVQQLIGQIKSRIDPSGVKEIVVRALGEDHIEIIIPMVDQVEADRIWNRAVAAGFLKFMIVANSSQVDHQRAIDFATREGELLKRKDEVVLSSDANAEPDAYWVSLGRESNKNSDGLDVPGNFRMLPMSVHTLRDRRTGEQIVPPPFEDEEQFTDWALDNGHEQIDILMMQDSQNGVVGEDLANVRQGIDRLARPCVNFRMKPTARKRMGKLTGRNEGELLGIVLDNRLLSAPSIQTQIIEDGQITGQFSSEEVEDLIGILKAGKLPAAINKFPISRDEVNSTIGQELATKGVIAIVISFSIVVVFMLIYYRFAGVVACLALFTNIVLIVAIICLIKQPITLTGLAGLVLTVGMSVDANVLIFERIREELDKGSTLRMAIRNGFGRATVTIVDANITTLITALVLYAIGTEQIRGFCVALILGILMSMFTAIFCSRVTFDIAEKLFLKKLNMMRLLKKTSFDFMGKRKVAMGISSVLILAGLVAAFGLGDSILGHDLRGGTTARIVFSSEQKVDDVRKSLSDSGKTIDGTEGGELIQWEVTEIVSDEHPTKTFFKIDSSLQPFEEERYKGNDQVTEATFPKLNEILEEVFSGKLKKYEVDYGTITEVQGDGQTSVQPQRTIESKEEAAQVVNATPAFSDRAADGLQFVALQDPSGQDGGSQDGGSQDGGAAGQGGGSQDTGDGSDSTTGTGQDAEAQNLEAQGDETLGAETQDTETQDGETAGAGSDTPSLASRRKFEVQVDFSFPTTGDGLKAVMDGFGQSEGLGIRETDIDVVPAEGNVDVPSAKKWTVTISANDQESVATLLAKTKEQYNQTTYFSSLSQVGGQIARESQVQALVAVLLSLVGIVAYIWVRFQRVVFGLAAVVALVHDVLIVLGAIAITGYVASAIGLAGFGAVKISLPVVAAFLTIIGYSLNDTIVVFDRIREVRGKNPDLTSEMVNRSIGQTLSRTILTSLTTFVVVFILLIAGGDAIQGFAFALTIGVIAGTYSSIFIASPVLLWLVHSQAKQRTKVASAPAKAVST